LGGRAVCPSCRRPLWRCLCRLPFFRLLNFGLSDRDADLIVAHKIPVAGVLTRLTGSRDLSKEREIAGCCLRCWGAGFRGPECLQSTMDRVLTRYV
jgi:hypothetical protein